MAMNPRRCPRPSSSGGLISMHGWGLSSSLIGPVSFWHGLWLTPAEDPAGCVPPSSPTHTPHPPTLPSCSCLLYSTWLDLSSRTRRPYSCWVNVSARMSQLLTCNDAVLSCIWHKCLIKKIRGMSKSVSPKKVFPDIQYSPKIDKMLCHHVSRGELFSLFTVSFAFLQVIPF